MFKMLINRSESSQVGINDSALRDIIPSNDIINTQKSKQKRFSRICKILFLIFILGLIAIGIVVLALVLAFSGKSFMNYIIPTPGETLSNKTRTLSMHEENLTTILDEQNWKKITFIPSSTVKINDKQLTSTTIQTTEETTVKTFTSTFIPKLRTPLTTETVFQSSTNSNKKHVLLTQYQKFEEDHILDDFFYS